MFCPPHAAGHAARRGPAPAPATAAAAALLALVVCNSPAGGDGRARTFTDASSAAGDDGNRAAAGSGETTPFSAEDIGALTADWSAYVQDNSPTRGLHVFTGLDANICLDVPNGLPSTGTIVHIFTCNFIAGAQIWSMIDGQLRVFDSKNIPWCLSLAGGSADANAPVVAPCTPPQSADPTQTWVWEAGMLRLASGQKCLALTAAAPQPQQPLTTFACDGNNAVQQWRLANLGFAADGNYVPMGVHLSSLSDPNLCLDLNLGDATAGVIQGYTCNQSWAQKWVFERGTITAQNIACVGVDGGAAVAGAAVKTMSCRAGDGLQAWQVVAGSIRLRDTGLCICLPAAGGGGQARLGNCPNSAGDALTCQWQLGAI